MKKFVKNNMVNFILIISILFLSCEVFYPYEDDCGVVDGSNKLTAGQCFETNNNSLASDGTDCCWSSICYNGDYDDNDCDEMTMCCFCGGGYTADGTEDCPFNPEIHN